MSDLLRRPWLLPAALRSLGHSIDPATNDHAPPKLIQLVDVHPTSKCVKAKVSDKHNYVIAVFTKEALHHFEDGFGGRSLESLRGAIIKLKCFFFNPYFETPDDPSSFIVPLVIEEFDYVGGEGSPVHGDPRFLMAVPLIRQIAERFTQTEASKLLESSFKPEDLINMGQSSGQTLEADQYMMVPEDQQEVLNSITPEKLTNSLGLSVEYFLASASKSEPVEHRIDPEDVAAKYGCQLNLESPLQSIGLDPSTIEKNREIYGPNILLEPKKKHPLLVYLSYMRNLFSIMLIVAGLLSIVVFILDTSTFVSLYVGIVFILVAFFNAFLELYQELKSQQVLEGFRSLMKQKTKVVRNCQIQEIDVAEVTVGDILFLNAGDTIPADARIIQCTSMKIDMSSLTGESVPKERGFEKTSQSADKAKCLLFKSSAVTSGHGLALVIRVGNSTLIGAIMSLSIGEQVETGELGKEIEVLIRRIVLVAAITGLLFMGVAFIQGLGVIPAFETAIGILVAFLPQGLPMTITILLTTAAKRLAAKNVLVKNLQAVETLGSLTVIATDKTGTLTQNQMEVEGGWTQGQLFDDISGQKELLQPILNCYAGSTTIQTDFSKPIEQSDLDTLQGDATELGLFRLAHQMGVDFSQYYSNHQKVVDVPFDSARKWNLTVIRDSTGQLVACLKGAPDKLVGYSIMEDSIKQEFERSYEHFASNGQRVIGFAVKTLKTEDEVEVYRRDPEDIRLDGFDFIGMLSVYDPPKDGVAEAIDQLRKSQIRVFMVTGDHPITAKAIAKKVGILKNDETLTITELNTFPPSAARIDSAVVHGDVVDEMDDEQWAILLKADELVFARTLPRHKLMIVKRLQAQGEIVGAIGDGVNDSPAIKRANLGISMNKTGSDISKDAALMVLLDDRFASIIAGVYEGRLIYQNLKKSIRYTLTHIMPEVLAFSSWVLFLIPPPLTPILVLMIDVGSELGPALSYAYEPAEIDLLKLPPRKRLIPQVPNVQKTVWYKRAYGAIKSPFVLRQKGETLIDSELVSWVYLQGGIIESIGCFGAYIISFVMLKVPLSSLWRSTGIYFYEPTQNLTLTDGTIATFSMQEGFMQKAQGAYYLSIIIGQLFNLFMTKSRYKYPLRKSAFKNKATYYGAAAAIIVGCLVVFVPGLQEVFRTNFVVALALASPVVTGVFMLFWEMARHKLHRSDYLK